MKPYPLPEVKRRMLAAGFTHVVTCAGPLPIATWTPYGRQDDGDDYHATIHEDRAVDAPKDGYAGPPFVLGAWQFIREVD